MSILPDIVRFPAEADRVDFTMIGLHGRDANGSAFFPFVRQMGFLHTQWLLPSAPFPSGSAHGIRRWFSAGEEQDAGISASRTLLTGLIDSCRAEGTAAENMFLVGFSQGAVMAVDTALRYPVRLGGVVSLSGFVAQPHALAAERHAANARMPVFLAHGLRDTVLPIEVGRSNRDILASLGNPLDYREYDTAHRISSGEVRDIRAFLHRHMYGIEADDPRNRDAHVAPF